MDILEKYKIERSFIEDMMECIIECDNDKLLEVCSEATEFYMHSGLTYEEAINMSENIKETAEDFVFGEG